MNVLRLIPLLSLFLSLNGYAINCSTLGASLNPPPTYIKEVEVPKQNDVQKTNEFIGYLGRLFEEQIIGVQELKRLAENLESGSLLNPILKNDTSISSRSHVHYEGLQRHLDEGKFDFNELDKWVREVIKTQSRVKTSRNKVKKQTQEVFSKMKFFPIPQGEFEMPRDGEVKTFSVDYPFEMGSTVVTQKQWVDIMGENPSKFARSPDNFVILVDGKSVILQPDHPVENISFWASLEFANRMSIREGLRPFYDMSEMEFTGRAEDGSLKVVSGQLKFSVADGNLAQTEGYRLPTIIERKYIASDLGKVDEWNVYGSDSKAITDYEWHKANSEGRTHAVGQLKPLVVNGSPFFDIHGNVKEMLSDKKDTLMRGYTHLSSGYVSGGSFSMDSEYFNVFHVSSIYLGTGTASTGFRLVRTLAEKPKQ